MLNPFPQLLVYSFSAPTLLRIAVAIVFLCMSLRFIRSRKELAKTPVPLIGAPGIALVFFVALIEAAIGFSLLFGWETQIAAIVGAVASLKHAWFARRYPLWSPSSRSTYLLVTVICLSLLLTGAGAFAMDLPL